MTPLLIAALIGFTPEPDRSATSYLIEAECVRTMPAPETGLCRERSVSTFTVREVLHGPTALVGRTFAEHFDDDVRLQFLWGKGYSCGPPPSQIERVTQPLWQPGQRVFWWVVLVGDELAIDPLGESRSVTAYPKSIARQYGLFDRKFDSQARNVRHGQRVCDESPLWEPLLTNWSLVRARCLRASGGEFDALGRFVVTSVLIGDDTALGQPFEIGFWYFPRTRCDFAPLSEQVRGAEVVCWVMRIGDQLSLVDPFVDHYPPPIADPYPDDIEVIAPHEDD